MPRKPSGKPRKPIKPKADPLVRERELQKARERIGTAVEGLRPGQIRFLNKWLEEGNEWMVDAYAARLGVPLELRPLFRQMIEERQR